MKYLSSFLDVSGIEGGSLRLEIDQIDENT